MNHKLFFFACTLNLFYYVPNLLASPVIGGQEDTDNIFKYHVSIKSNYHPKTADLAKLLCGGAIIHDKYVLTAAHCFMDKKNGHVEKKRQPRSLRVVILAGISETSGLGIIRPVSTVFIPLEYNIIINYEGQHIYNADIAVLKLVAELSTIYNSNGLPILELDPGRFFFTYDHQKAFVMGNGCDALLTGADGVSMAHPDRVADKRHFLEVQMLGRQHCPNYLFSICAVSADKAGIHSCAQGDTGSPLVYENTIIGVLQPLSSRFTTPGPVMSFTRVSTFTNFINDAMNEDTDHSKMYILNQ